MFRIVVATSLSVSMSVPRPRETRVLVDLVLVWFIRQLWN